MKTTKGKARVCLMAVLLFAVMTIGGTATEVAAKEAGNLDQVRNGAADSPISPVNWENGNVGSQTGHFIEGYSIPYRLRLTDLTVGANYVDIEWDIKHSDKHAIDYVTRFDYINTPPHQNVFDHPAELIDPRALTVPADAFPIAGPENTMPFPDDTSLHITPIPIADRYMTLWGGIIDSMAYLIYGDTAASQSSTQLRIWFHATNDSALFAWGGHIGSRADWGFDPISGEPNSAGGISGSPYHTRFIELNGAGGNQDRSLSAVAVYVPCGTCDIAGDDPVCPGSTHVYTSTITGTCETPGHNWIVTGGTIVGPADGPTVTVEFPLSCGTATIKDSTTCTGCTGSPLVCEMIVNVVDETPPVLSGCPSDATYDCYNLVPAQAVVTATDNCAGTLPVTFSENQSNPGSSCNNIITRTWIAVDDCGNADTCKQIITVDDNTAPVISGVGGPSTIECPATPTFSNPTASDNCDLSPSLTYVDSTFPGACPQEYSVKRTWTATDDCNNTAKASQTVTVTDNTAPIISGVGGPATIECPATPSFSNPTASDACDVDVTLTHVDSTFPGACPQEYSVKRTWTATDDCGNTAKASQTITVEDNTPPVITCPANVRVNCDAIVDFGTATAIDACDPDPDVTYDDDTLSTQCPLTINRQWTATDACGNSASCMQVITIIDETPPVISGVGGPMTIECPATPTFSNPTAGDNCDQSPSLTFDDVTTPGACPQEYSVTRTWTATDFCGNTSTASQTITVEDTTPPMITCPGDVTFECDAVGDFGLATATDACDPDPSLAFADRLTPGDCPQEYVITRTWTATDACGNSASCTQVITVVDTTAPVISGVGGPMTIECPAEPVFSDPTVSDNCDPDPSLTFNDVTTPGSCPQEYSVTRTWTATDACDNSATASQTITVTDNTPPLITCPNDVIFNCDAIGDFGVATALDACDPDPDVTYDDDTLSTQCPLTINREWTATDACGNSASCMQVITIIDNTPPVISGVGGPATIECPAVPVFSSPSARDNCDPAPSLTFADVTTPGACPQEYSITRTWTATDFCENTSTASQTITVTDNTPPVISGVGGPATIECPAMPEFSTPTAADACDAEVTLTFVDDTTQGACPQEYVVRRTWTATDDCGNSATASQTITVEDSTPPTFTFCAADDTIACAEDLIFTPPTAEDACDPDPVITELPTDTTAGPGAGEVTYSRSWVATDACGNVSDTCTQTIIRETCQEGCTFTIGGWGSDCPESQSGNMMSTQPGCVRDHYFSEVFPGGVVIVGYPTGYTARWTSSAAIAAYLPPLNGGAKILTTNYVNPTATTKTGILVAQILGLTLNREYSCAGVFFDLGLWESSACYGDHVIGPECGSKFVGLTVDQFLLLANKVISGQTNLLQPYGASLSDLNQTATCLNELFDGCDPFAMISVASASDTEIPDENALPSEFSLEQNKPNPFNPSSQISFNLPEATYVKLEVFNIVGQKVATLVDGQIEAGYHTVTWDASDVVTGIYLYRLQTSTFISTKKMVLLK